MHLIVIIALGIFAGNYLFSIWLEWHAQRFERREWRNYYRKEAAAAKAAKRGTRTKPVGLGYS